MNNDKIFISIPAWEDTHLTDTMNHILETSIKPDNIVFGLGLKYEIYPDLSKFNNIKIIKDDDIYNGKPGIIGIREAIRGLITDETYYLGIDAHADFEFGWDKKLIDDINLLSQNKEKVIMSRQATAKIQNKNNWQTDWFMYGNKNNFNVYGQPTLFSNIKQDIYTDRGYFKNYYFSCNFVFGKVVDIKKIDWPSYHRFPFEEPEQSLALYCQGYDIVAPLKDNIVHYAGNDSKYVFPYDEKWWEFIGTDRSDPDHWTKIWIVDDEEMTKEVRKLLLFGKNQYYNLINRERSHIDFYKDINLYDKYKEIINEKS